MIAVFGAPAASSSKNIEILMYIYLIIHIFSLKFQILSHSAQIFIIDETLKGEICAHKLLFLHAFSFSTFPPTRTLTLAYL